MSNRKLSKLLEIDMQLAKGGLSKEEEMKLEAKKWQIMNSGDMGFKIFLVSFVLFLSLTAFIFLQ